jgi:hypothetical protein
MVKHGFDFCHALRHMLRIILYPCRHVIIGAFQLFLGMLVIDLDPVNAMALGLMVFYE